MDRISLTPLKIIESENGSVLHGMKKSDETYLEFGEVYFSEVKKDCVKGWKRHNLMTLNLIVVSGCIKFVIFDGTKFCEYELSRHNYSRLTVPPGFWVAFKGLDEINMLMNIADIEHLQSEADNVDLRVFNYEW